MKCVIFLAVAVIINTLYWAWSEMYIYDGTLEDGILKGVAASILFAVIPFAVGFFVAVKKESK